MVNSWLQAACAALGVHLLVSAAAVGSEDAPTGEARDGSATPSLARRLGADLPLAPMVVLAILGAGLGFVVFASPLPTVVAAAGASLTPLGAARVKDAERREQAQEAWPRLLEEIRILTTSLGRSIPQAVVDVGRRAPDTMRPAFDAATREWLVSTDFERMLAVLKAQLADPTADITCETLLVAHEMGGADLGRRLAELIEDRSSDIQARRDARAKQAGARFSRRFVVVAPLGMAMTGLSIGSGRDAFATATGQIMATTALVLVACCWMWSGRILRIPAEGRVFVR